jgi:hypothetical protein
VAYRENMMAGIQIPNFVVVLVAILLIVLVCIATQEAQFTLRPPSEAAFSDYLQAQIAWNFPTSFLGPRILI